MELIYIASASAGNRRDLWFIATAVNRSGHFVFVPMLGFMGKEDDHAREVGLDACFWLIKHWATKFTVFYEGISSVGIWDELKFAYKNGIPCAVIISDKKIPFPILPIGVAEIRDAEQLKRWLDEL